MIGNCIILTGTVVLLCILDLYFDKPKFTNYKNNLIKTFIFAFSWCRQFYRYEQSDSYHGLVNRQFINRHGFNYKQLFDNHDDEMTSS